MPLIISENIVSGEPLEFEIDIGLGELQLLLLKAHGDKVLQVDGVTGETLTASLALNRAICLAKWLQSIGIKQGDAVTVNSENRIEFVTMPLALFFIGAVYTPLNPEYTKGELLHVLKLSKPKLAFCSKSQYGLMKSVMANIPSIKTLVVYGKKKIQEPNMVMYEDIIQNVVDGPVDEEYEPVKIDPKETVATILYSSGTTGLPKGVMTTHANMTAFVEIARSRFAEIADGSEISNIVTMGFTPFFHSMGFMSMYMNFIAGNMVVVLGKFKIVPFLESISKYKITTLIIPPPVILLILKHPLVNKYDLSSLKDVRSGAAAMGKDMEIELKKRFNLDHVSQGYGMTETTLGVLGNAYDSPRLGSVGQVVPGMQCKVIDEKGKALGPSEHGELCFKGPLIMKGYIGDIAATKETIDEGGWLHTGDIGYFDKDGYFFIVDRIKELIKYKGFQVAPAELESILLTHPAVADAAVTSIPDTAAGELPVAFVVRKAVAVTENEIKTFVASKVSRHKQLHGGIRFVESIPKNASGKILRRVLKEQAKTKSKL